MGYSNGILTAPINVRADLAPALGRATGDVGQLCGDLRWDSQLTTPAWVRAGGINPMAKFKSVRSSKVSQLTLQDRLNVRFGFGGMKFIHPATAITNPGNWEYQPPRGIKNTSINPTNNDEWFRVLDFDGYAKMCICPYRFCLAYNTVYQNDVFIVQNWFNDQAEHVYEDEGDYEHYWVEDLQGNPLNMEVKDFLGSLNGQGTDYYSNSYYLSYILIDNTQPSRGQNLILTNKGIKDAADSGYFESVLSPTQFTDDGITYPAIPLLDSNGLDHSFTIIACFGNISSGWPEIGYAYKVVTSNFPTMMSLAFMPNMERKTFNFVLPPSYITGAITSVELRATNDYYGDPASGSAWRKFLIWKVQATITVGSYPDGTSSGSVLFVLTFPEDGSVWTGSVPEVSGGNVIRAYKTATGFTPQVITVVNEETMQGSVWCWLQQGAEDAIVEVTGTAQANAAGYQPVTLSPGMSNVIYFDDNS